MADQTLSGVPPVITLSGLQSGGAFSGQGQQNLSGYGSAPQGGVTPGLTGGLDLMQLMALLAQQAGPGTDASLTAPLGAGAFGQLGGQGGGFGGIGGGGLGGAPMGGQSQVAGQTGQQSAASATGSVDPLSIIQKTLGLASKGAGLLSDTGTASPTLGDTGGTSLSDQNRSAQGGTGGFTASPVSTNPYGQIDPQTGLPLPGTQQQPISGPGGVPATGFGELPGGGTGGQDPASLVMLNQYSGGDVPPSLAALGITKENLPQFLSAMGQAEGPQAAQIMGTGGLGTGLGEIPGVGITGGGSQGLGGAAGGLSGTGGVNTFGALSGGLSGLQGLLAAIQGLTGQGTDLSKVLSTLQGLGGAASGAGAASDALGLTSGLGGAIGGFGAPAGVLAQIASILGSRQTPEVQNQEALQAGISGITAPLAGAGAASAAGAAEAGSTLAALAPALSAISGPLAFTGPALGVVMAIMQALDKPGNRDINRFTGVQGPQTTQALEKAASLTPANTDYSQLPTDVLERLIPAQANTLERYYNQNLPEQRYLGGLQASGSPEYGQVQGDLGTTNAGLLQTIAQLQQRGVGNDVIGNILTPQLSNIAQSYNPAYAGGGFEGYQSPAAVMQQYGLTNNQQLAQAYGGPTWLALNQFFGPQLGSLLGQYGGTAPAFTAPAQTDFAALFGPQDAGGATASSGGGVGD